ncbi:MAG: hypothetical protein AAF471_05640 [Myxococcota bacterium]
MSLFFLVLAVLIVAFGGMAIGVITSRNGKCKELQGSCGGPDLNPDCCMRRRNSRQANNKDSARENYEL